MAAHSLPRFQATLHTHTRTLVEVGAYYETCIRHADSLTLCFSCVLDNERVVELLQAIKEKSITLDTIRHAAHPLCKSPPAQLSGKTHANESKHTHFFEVFG